MSVRRSVMAIAIAAQVVRAAAALAAQAPAAADKVTIVAVAGCVTEQGPNNWLLTSATDPEPSIANAPPANQPHKGPTTGKNQYKMIGVSEFDLPAHKGHTVLVKALFIKAAPVSRLNVTSVTMLSPSCGAPGK